MLSKQTNPVLTKTEQAVTAKVPPKLKGAFSKTVTVGLKMMYSDQGQKIMKDQLSKSPDYARNVAEGAAKLIGEMFKQSKNTMPVKVAMSAAVMLMCEGLDFLEKAGKLKVTPELVATATKHLSEFVLQLFGVTQDKLHQLVQQRQSQQTNKPQGIIGSAKGQ